MNKDMSAILAKCIDEVLSKGSSVDEVLKRHPEHSAELAPLLRLALQLPAAPDVEPSAEFRAQLRRTLLTEMARPTVASQLRKLFQTRLLPPIAVPRGAASLAVAGALVFVLLMGAGAGVTYASQTSLPGDSLYQVKRASEQGRILIAFGPENKTKYQLQLASERLQELVALAEAGRAVDPAMVEDIADHLDAALEQARKAQPQQAQAILAQRSEELGRQQEEARNVVERRGPGVTQLVSSIGLLIQREGLVAQTLTEQVSGAPSLPSLTALREVELEGPISSLMPLRIAGVEVVVPPEARVDGILALNAEAEFKGVLLADGTVRASRIKVEEASEGERRFALRGVITGVNPLTIAGKRVVLEPGSEVRGTLTVGLIASLEGWFLEDGSVVASKVDIERLRKDTAIVGPITQLEPLTVGSTVVVLSPGAKLEGAMGEGAVVDVKGHFLDDGRFQASAIEPEEGREQRLTGLVVNAGRDTLELMTPDGQKVIVRVTPSTRIEGEGDSKGKEDTLQPGSRVEVRYGAESGLASRVKVERSNRGSDDEDSGPKKENGSSDRGSGQEKDNESSGRGSDQEKDSGQSGKNGGPGSEKDESPSEENSSSGHGSQGEDQQDQRDEDGSSSGKQDKGQEDDRPAATPTPTPGNGGSGANDSQDQDRSGTDGETDQSAGDGNHDTESDDRDNSSDEEAETASEYTKVRGVIRDITDSTIVVENEVGTRFTVRINEDTRFRIGDSRVNLRDFTVGKFVVIEFAPDTGLAHQVRSSEP